MAGSKARCAECGTEFEVDLGPGDVFDCAECGAAVEVPESRTAARPRGAAGRGSGSRRGGRAAAPAKKSPVGLIAVLGVLVVAVIVVVFMLMKSSDDGPGTDGGGSGDVMAGAQGKKPPSHLVSDPAKAKKKKPSIFDAAAGDGSGEEAAPAGPKRVTGRAPKTVDMSKLLEHSGALYLTPETDDAITALNAEVERFKDERWDISKELKDEFRRLTKAVAAEKNDRWGSMAQSELNRLNILFEKSDVRLRDESNKLFDEALVGFARRPFAFYVQRSQEGGEEEIANRVHDQLTQLKEAFDDYFDDFVELKENERNPVIKVLLFRTFDDYQTYNREREPERDRDGFSVTLAHYEPSARMLVVPLKYEGRTDRGAEQEIREIMFHEGTHQLLHFYADKGKGEGSHLSAFGSMWSDEGVAEFFGGHTATKDPERASGLRYHFGKVNMLRLPSLAYFADKITFDDLLTWTRYLHGEKEKEDQRRADEINLSVYAQGWALVYFLNNYEGGRYKDKFGELMKLQIDDGDCGYPAFRTVFGNDLEKVAAEFEKYMGSLVRALRDRKVKDGELVEK